MEGLLVDREIAEIREVIGFYLPSAWDTRRQKAERAELALDRLTATLTEALADNERLTHLAAASQREAAAYMERLRQ